MPKVTEVRPQKNKKRVNIYIDGKFAFGLDLENFVKTQLKVDQELSEENINKIIETAEFQKTLDKLLKYAMLRPRSEKEIRDWFIKRKVHESLKNRLFDKLKYFDLIDDEKFALWWVDQRQRFRPKSKLALNQELKAKGIDKYIIENVLEKRPVDEVSVAKEIIQKKMYLFEKLAPLERRRRIGEFLGRRGFSWEIIKKVIDFLKENH